MYQGESVAGPWRRIATFDVINGSAIIFDNQFDEGSGVVVNSPAQFGGDSGIRHYIELTEDKVLGGRLITGKTYFFAVTAYSLNESRSPKTLETALAPLADGRMTFKPLSDELIPANGIVPRSPTAGTRFNAVGVDSLVAHTQGSSDGIVAVQVVDETRVTGASYEVRFRETDEGHHCLGFGQFVERASRAFRYGATRDLRGGRFQSGCRGVARARDRPALGH